MEPPLSVVGCSIASSVPSVAVVGGTGLGANSSTCVGTIASATASVATSVAVSPATSLDCLGLKVNAIIVMAITAIAALAKAKEPVVEPKSHWVRRVKIDVAAALVNPGGFLRAPALEEATFLSNAANIAACPALFAEGAGTGIGSWRSIVAVASMGRRASAYTG